MGAEEWVSESRVLGRWKGLQAWSLRVQESMDWRESRALRDMGKNGKGEGSEMGIHDGIEL